MEDTGNTWLGFHATRGLRPLRRKADLQERLARRTDLRVTVYTNPNLVRPRYPFVYEDPDQTELAVLRDTFNLETVVRTGGTELEKLVALRGWVKRRWVHAAPDTPDHERLHALDMLRLARQGKRFYCHHYAVTFVQCCLALGWQARVLGIRKRGNGGHNVAEVWLDSLGKWAVMDPDYDCHYERSGEPLNALELHRISQRGKRALQMNGVSLHLGAAGAASEQGEQIQSEPMHLVDFYYLFFLFMGNAFFRTAPDAPILSVAKRRLRWYDRRTPREISAGCRLHAGRYYRDTFSNRLEDFYWDLHRVHLDLGAVGDRDRLRVYPATRTPGFRGFRVQVDCGKCGTVKAPFVWKLHRGSNVLDVSALDNRGRPVGASSTIGIERQ